MNDQSLNGPTQTAVHELIRQMIDQNVRRDQQLTNILEQMTIQRNEQPFSVMPDLNSTIDNFDGESGDCGIAERWLTSLQTTGQLNRWTDLYLLECARSHLSGAAKNWYLGRQSDIQTWSKFKECFKTMFMSSAGLAKQWKRVQARIQQRNETIFAYFHDKMRMCRQLSLSEMESKKLLCIGLHSRELCNMLMSKIHKDECELLRDIRDFTEINNERVERFKTSNSTVGKPKERTVGHQTMKTPNKSNTTEPQEQKAKPFVSTTVRRNYNEVRCYNCQLGGHIARDCTKPKRALHCSKCGQEGHTAKYCVVSHLK